ncbi:hypothetical protein H0H87_000746 [Tephrocybe sp. NHM501043]|nr:hypothetical protein H0H87_000746 [Tephrocybe sp. NHM501043]
MFRYDRSASIAVTAFGAVFNLALTVQVITASRSALKWEPESEWEASGDSWQVDGVKVIWGLCCAHFALAAAVCMVGFIGISKSKPTLVRFYRDYSIADFSFCTFVTAMATFAVFSASARAAICEELSHHPELLQDLMEMGLNLENCERWLERGGLAFVALMFILLVVRAREPILALTLSFPFSRSIFRSEDIPTPSFRRRVPPRGRRASIRSYTDKLYPEGPPRNSNGGLGVLQRPTVGRR